VRTFVARRPLPFSLLLVLTLFILTCASMSTLPRTTVSNVEDVPAELKEQPSGSEQILAALMSPEVLFQALAILLAVVLISLLNWWREAGFTRPSRWRNLHLLYFPLLVIVLTLLGGVRDVDPVHALAALLGLIFAVFGEELIFRSVMFGALAPTGIIRAMVVASLLSSVVRFGRLLLVGPWPEAFLLTIPAFCGGFTYAALRWRITSIWPVILVHLALGFANNVSMTGNVPYLRILLYLAGTLGFVGYGLFLLRSRRARADGGPPVVREPVRAT
jgi:membrane protease YdiL (CAAX protease family)